jgi:hypothetical protein
LSNKAPVSPPCWVFYDLRVQKKKLKTKVECQGISIVFEKTWNAINICSRKTNKIFQTRQWKTKKFLGSLNFRDFKSSTVLTFNIELN